MHERDVVLIDPHDRLLPRRARLDDAEHGLDRHAGDGVLKASRITAMEALFGGSMESLRAM